MIIATIIAIGTTVSYLVSATQIAMNAANNFRCLSNDRGGWSVRPDRNDRTMFPARQRYPVRIGTGGATGIGCPAADAPLGAVKALRGRGCVRSGNRTGTPGPIARFRARRLPPPMGAVLLRAIMETNEN